MSIRTIVYQFTILFSNNIGRSTLINNNYSFLSSKYPNVRSLGRVWIRGSMYTHDRGTVVASNFMVQIRKLNGPIIPFKTFLSVYFVSFNIWVFNVIFLHLNVAVNYCCLIVKRRNKNGNCVHTIKSTIGH